MPEPVGFFTDTTVCIGCKACQVACHQWNDLPAKRLEPVCNGCRDCAAACPFGVIHMSERTHVAQKCTFCYDRLKIGLAPACAQACPTQSIKFGPIAQLKKDADARLSQLHKQGETK